MPDEKTTVAPGTVAPGLGVVGSPTAPPSGTLQTTINTDTTTINPNSSILNPVKPDGSPAPLKHAVVPSNVSLAGPAVPAPGTVAPGTVAPGTVAPGTVAPGTVAPGTVAPGTTLETPAIPATPGAPMVSETPGVAIPATPATTVVPNP